MQARLSGLLTPHCLTATPPAVPDASDAQSVTQASLLNLQYSTACVWFHLDGIETPLILQVSNAFLLFIQ